MFAQACAVCSPKSGAVSEIAIFRQLPLILSRLNAILPPLSRRKHPVFPKESLSAVGDLPEMVDIVAAFACEARYRALIRSTRRSFHLGSLLWAVGVVAFLVSVASPYDDALQQEPFRPRSTYVAIRRLPSAPTGTRRIEVVPRLSVVVSKAFVLPMVWREVESDTETLLAIRFRSYLALRSPPPIH
jgi:hypothetical protein